MGIARMMGKGITQRDYSMKCIPFEIKVHLMGDSHDDFDLCMTFAPNDITAVSRTTLDRQTAKAQVADNNGRKTDSR